MGTKALAQILERLRAEYDYVLIDAPPILAVGDAMTISTRVDAMFVVVRLGQTDRQTLRDWALRLNEDGPSRQRADIVMDSGNRQKAHPPSLRDTSSRFAI